MERSALKVAAPAAARLPQRSSTESGIRTEGRYSVCTIRDAVRAG